MDKAFSTLKNMIARGDHDAALERGTALVEKSPHKLDLLIDLGNLALELERFQEAASYLKQAIALKPHAADLMNQLGTAEMLGGALDNAVTSFENALAIKPDFEAARFNLAIAHKRQNDFTKALPLLLHLYQKLGTQQAVLSELADTYDVLGDFNNAMNCYRLLLKQDENQTDLRLRMVDLSLRAGQVSEARDRIRFFESQSDASSLSDTAYLFFRDGFLDDAARLFKKALDHDESHARARLGLAEIYRRQVPRWHFPMLNDEKRNEAYDEAIKRTVKPGDIVIDIGAGSGLLAMMAARAGAAHVYSCEAVPLIAEQAQKIIAANHLSDKITIYPLRSNALEVGTHIPEKADVLISEILDRLLIGESMLPTLRHALTHLVKEDAVILPRRGRLFATPIESESLHKDDRCLEAAGFDVSAFNDFANVGVSAMLQSRKYDVRELGPHVELFAFDFTTSAHETRERELDLTLSEKGLLHGVMLWFEVDIDDDVTLNNHPDKGDEHWGFSASLLDVPRPVSKGDVLSITATQTMTSVDLRIV